MNINRALIYAASLLMFVLSCCIKLIVMAIRIRHLDPRWMRMNDR
jgi:hypothetical protein